MHPLSGPPAEDEQSPHDNKQEAQVSVAELLIWFVRLTAIGYALGLVTRLLSEDEIRLQLMFNLIRLFQSVARTVGGWALETEKAYNEYVESLH